MPNGDIKVLPLGSKVPHIVKPEELKKKIGRPPTKTAEEQTATQKARNEKRKKAKHKGRISDAVDYDSVWEQAIESLTDELEIDNLTVAMEEELDRQLKAELPDILRTLRENYEDEYKKARSEGNVEGFDEDFQDEIVDAFVGETSIVGDLEAIKEEQAEKAAVAIEAADAGIDYAALGLEKPIFAGLDPRSQEFADMLKTAPRALKRMMNFYAMKLATVKPTKLDIVKRARRLEIYGLEYLVTKALDQGINPVDISEQLASMEVAFLGEDDY